MYNVYTEEEEDGESAAAQHSRENSVTMSKMKLLKAKMEDMNLSKKVRRVCKCRWNRLHQGITSKLQKYSLGMRLLLRHRKRRWICSLFQGTADIVVCDELNMRRYSNNLERPSYSAMCLSSKAEKLFSKKNIL